MWKDTLVRAAYSLLRPAGFSHERLLGVLHNRIRHPQWTRIVRKTRRREALQPHPDGPRVVVLSMVGNMPLVHFELPLALALQARGANVEMIFCDGTQRQLCSQLTLDTLERRAKEDVCRYCFWNARRLLQDVPFLKYRRLSDLVCPQRNAELLNKARNIPARELEAYEEDGVHLGDAALQTALRYWRRGSFLATPQEEMVNRKMLHSAMLTLEAVKTLNDESPIHTALFSHGIYESWGPAADFFKRQGTYWATYGEQARKGTYVFTANASCRLADIRKPFDERWRGRPLTDQQRDKALQYLRSRSDFSQDLLKLTYGRDVESQEVLQRLNLRSDVPILTLYGNVAWDAAAVGRDLVFKNFIEWVVETIRFAAQRPQDLQLIVKPHPSEAIRGTRQWLEEEVRKEFPQLPANVVLLSPKTEINAHSIMRITMAGLVHTSTVGMEMSIMGVPTVVTSWTHYRGYGFTFDPASRQEYFSLLANPRALREQMTAERQELALKYFYVRSFHSWIDLPLVRLDKNRGPYGWNLESLDDLLPGRNENLDFICDGVMNHRSDFVQD